MLTQSILIIWSHTCTEPANAVRDALDKTGVASNYRTLESGIQIRSSALISADSNITCIEAHIMPGILEVSDPDERRRICADIIGALPDWFGIAEANAGYIEGVATKAAFCVLDNTGDIVGMLSLNHPYPTNADIYWVGIRPEHHRKGIGQLLFNAAAARAKELGCETMTVETLSDADPDPGYARTRAWYMAMGFKPLFGLKPYGDDNPMVYMMKLL